jgi:hypothetical protein
MLSQDRVQFLVLNLELHHRVPYKAGNFSIILATTSFSRRILLYDVSYIFHGVLTLGHYPRNASRFEMILTMV